ncbi:MAG: glucose-6-phosphate dehydrogenase, partial [Anaerolineales bacterium]
TTTVTVWLVDLRSGKALADKVTEIIVQFKCPPITMFPGVTEDAFTSNVIGLCLQPDEGIHLRFEAKVPDTAADTRSVRMDFHYAESFGPTAIPEAYERLLLDAINGDASLFTRGDAHELTWGLMDPILQGWQSEAAPPLQEYEPGGWGPRTADELLARDGRAWLRVCAGH